MYKAFAMSAAIGAFLLSAQPSQAQPARCELEGTWQHGAGGETWTFTRQGGNRFVAREQGFGNATGFATVEGGGFRIDYVVNEGAVTGTYWLRFAPDCSAASGRWRARTRDGGWPYDTPDRGSTSMTRVD